MASEAPGARSGAPGERSGVPGGRSGTPGAPPGAPVERSGAPGELSRTSPGCHLGSILVWFQVKLELKIFENSYLKFDAVLRCILGAPGGPRARKVWFYLRKTRVFEYQPFLPRATLGSILEPKITQKGAKMAPKWLQNGSQNGFKKHVEKTIAKRAPRGAPRVPSCPPGCPRGDPGKPGRYEPRRFGAAAAP